MDKAVNAYFKQPKKRFSHAVEELTFYAASLILSFVLFLTVKPLYSNFYGGFVPKAVAAAIIIAIAIYSYRLYKSDRLTTETAIKLIIATGVILRLSYTLCTPASVRQHDTYNKAVTGHEAYAYTIFSTGKLPTTNDYQFYHPPLNAIFQAGFMHFTDTVSSFLTKIFNLGNYFPDAFLQGKPSYTEEYRYFLYSSCQCLSFLYSLVTCVSLIKLLRLFDVKGKTLIALSFFIVFFPRHIQFSAQLNNDALSYALSSLALYFTVKWWKKGKRFSDIIACALCVGSGMCAKLSSATVCAPIAAVFICEFVRSILKCDGSPSLPRIITQYVCFLTICAPIGLWFQVYAKIRFDQNFGFVFSNLNSKLYTGDHSVFGRFFIAFDLKEYFGWLWCEPFEGQYNLFNYCLRSALFGEFSYGVASDVPYTVVVCTFAIAALVTALASAISLFGCEIISVGQKIKHREKYSDDHFELTLFTVVLTLSQILSEVYFYVKMPYGCTMDFRYIMPLIPAIALCLVLTGKRLKTCGIPKFEKLYSFAWNSTLSSVCFSAIFYLVCI